MATLWDTLQDQDELYADPGGWHYGGGPDTGEGEWGEWSPGFGDDLIDPSTGGGGGLANEPEECGPNEDWVWYGQPGGDGYCQPTAWMEDATAEEQAAFIQCCGYSGYDDICPDWNLNTMSCDPDDDEDEDIPPEEEYDEEYEEDIPPGQVDNATECGYIGGEWNVGTQQCTFPDITSPTPEGAVAAQTTSGVFHSDEWQNIIEHGSTQESLAEYLAGMTSEDEDMDWGDFVETNWQYISEYLDPDMSKYHEATGQLESKMQELLAGGYETQASRDVQLGKMGFAGVGEEFLDDFGDPDFGSSRLGFKEDVYGMEEEWASDFWQMIQDMSGATGGYGT